VDKVTLEMLGSIGMATIPGVVEQVIYANFVLPWNSVAPYWTWSPRQIPQPPCLLNYDVTGCFIKESANLISVHYKSS